MSDRRTIPGPIRQAVAPILKDNPHLTPQEVLERIYADRENFKVADFLYQNYAAPLSAVRYACRVIRGEIDNTKETT